MSETNWWTLLSRHWGKVMGGLFGLLFALLVVKFGFWTSIFIFVCIGAGILIGWRLDLDVRFKRWVDRLFPPRGN